MAEVALHTLQLTSAGGITCRYCSIQAFISQGAVFLLWDNGSALKIEFPDGEVAHQCGRLRELYCPTCPTGVERIVTPPTRGRQRRGWRQPRTTPFCATCGDEARSRTAVR